MTKSGITPSKEAVETYMALKEKKKYKFATFKLNDTRDQVVVADVGEPNSTFEDFLSVVPKDRLRYLVYDVDFVLQDGGKRNKVLVSSWVNDNGCDVREKLLSAATFDAIKNKFVGAGKYATINDWEDLTKDTFIDLVK